MRRPRLSPELQTDLAKGREPLLLDENPDRDQIVERLGWTPKQRLDYLVEMVAFEERAHRARRIG